jgi:hypothetical protein
LNWPVMDRIRASPSVEMAIIIDAVVSIDKRSLSKLTLFTLKIGHIRSLLNYMI